MINLIILGAGNIGKMVSMEILTWGDEAYEKIFYYDNDCKKQGTYINNVWVLTYEEFLIMIHQEKCKIILATDRWMELLEFCQELKIENKIISIYNSINFNANPYIRRIYGQDAEEIYLSEKIGQKYGTKYRGFYVDIGAHHPYRFSNTYWAYKMG